MQKSMQETILRLFRMGKSISEISAATTVSRPVITKFIKSCNTNDLAKNSKASNGLGSMSALNDLNVNAKMLERTYNGMDDGPDNEDDEEDEDGEALDRQIMADENIKAVTNFDDDVDDDEVNGKFRVI